MTDESDVRPPRRGKYTDEEWAAYIAELRKICDHTYSVHGQFCAVCGERL